MENRKYIQNSHVKTERWKKSRTRFRSDPQDSPLQLGRNSQINNICRRNVWEPQNWTREVSHAIVKWWRIWIDVEMGIYPLKYVKSSPCLAVHQKDLSWGIIFDLKYYRQEKYGPAAWSEGEECEFPED